MEGNLKVTPSGNPGGARDLAVYVRLRGKNSRTPVPKKPAEQAEDQAPEEDGIALEEAPEVMQASATLTLEKEPEAADSGKLQILITGGRSALTVREGVELLLINQGLEVLELPGDAELLDSTINTTVALNVLDDLYAASNGKIGNIVIDRRVNKIRLISSSVVMPAPVAEKATLPPQDEQAADTAPLVSIRDLTATYAKEHDKTLLELPGDAVLLDMKVSATSIRDLGELSHLTNQAVGGVLVDNNNGTIRVLSQAQVVIEPVEVYKKIRELVSEFAKTGGFKLLELPGDRHVLDQRTQGIDSLAAWEDLYKLEDVDIQNVYIDQATKTIRVI